LTPVQEAEWLFSFRVGSRGIIDLASVKCKALKRGG
jgi:hypothetical protein